MNLPGGAAEAASAGTVVTMPPAQQDGAPQAADAPSAFGCRLCNGRVAVHAVAPGGALYRCAACGFVFFHSGGNGYDPSDLFARAYTGNERAASMTDFALKMRLRVDAQSAGIDPARLLNAAQQDAADIVERRFPKGATILDIGCGTGYFVRAMKARGFSPFGLDVAEPVVRLLRLDGFPVWHGTIETVPARWVEPDLCTAFFMLHHTLDPVGFLKTIRTKFPHAHLFLAVYDDLDGGLPRPAAHQLPPRTHSWWGVEHLRLALQAAGYRPDVRRVTRRTTDGGLPVSMGFYQWLARRSGAAGRRFLRWYYGTVPMWGWASVFWDRRIRRFNDPILGIGIPS